MLEANASLRMQRWPPKRQAGGTNSRSTSNAASHSDSRLRMHTWPTDALELIAEREALGAIVADAEEARVRERVERTQIGRWREIYECRRSGNDGGADRKDIELRAESGGVAIEEIRFDARPAASVQSLQERFNRGDGFRGSEGAVAGAIDEGLTQQAAVIVHTVHDVFVGCFIF